MSGIYLGHLAHSDPLYGYLCSEIVPQLGLVPGNAFFRVFQPPNSRHVYIYEEKHSGVRFVGKFDPDRGGSGGGRISSGETEYNNLVFLRSLGFDSPPHYVVRPLGFNRSIGNVLIVEYLDHPLLGTVINDAIHARKIGRLYSKLSAVAIFLGSIHNLTAGDLKVNFENSHSYMGRLIGALIVKRGMGKDHSAELFHLREAWRYQGCMWEDRSVLVHGDVTPSNILLGSGKTVMAIDLERMQWSDRTFDLGRICGELKHIFFQATGSFNSAEPYIGHLLWEYCSGFPDQMSAFRAVTKRLPFYMGINLLRIARNSWISNDYRWLLVREAKKMLRALP